MGGGVFGRGAERLEDVVKDNCPEVSGFKSLEPRGVVN